MADMSGKYTIQIPQIKKVAVAYSGGLDSALSRSPKSTARSKE